MKRQAIATISTAFFLMALTVGMASVGTAASFQNDTETSNVDVDVSAETALDVKPDQLTYTDVAVGDRDTETDDAVNYTQIKVENTGSNDIEKIWANVDTPTSNPFGTGTTTDHIATNFLQLNPYDPNGVAQLNNVSTYNYVERVEFFQEQSPLVELGSFDSSNPVEVGRVRFGNNEFYVALQTDGSGSCNEMRVANSPTLPGSLGTNDFSDSNSGNYNSYTFRSAGAASGYDLTNESVVFNLDDATGISGTETQEYDILAACDTSGADGISERHLKLTKWNIESGGADDLSTNSDTAVNPLWDSEGDNEASQLHPGSSFAVDVSIMTPRGVPSGSLSTGTLSVYSQAYTG